jgi:hypothetical protein
LHREVGLSALLLVALLLPVFVLRPLVELGFAGRGTIALAVALVLCLGMWTVWGGWARMLVAGLSVGISVALRALQSVTGSATLAPWAAMASGVSVGIFIVLLLGLVFGPGRVTRRRIFGAVAIYLLFGLASAQFYEGVADFVPGAFVLPQGGSSADTLFSPLLYYSFITLTTLGYGDVLPVHPVARSLAMVQALVGQLYPAILLARLVSLHAADESAAGAGAGAGG